MAQQPRRNGGFARTRDSIVPACFLRPANSSLVRRCWIADALAPSRAIACRRALSAIFTKCASSSHDEVRTGQRALWRKHYHLSNRRLARRCRISHRRTDAISRRFDAIASMTWRAANSVPMASVASRKSSFLSGRARDSC